MTMNNDIAGQGPLERPVRPLVERLRDIAHGMNAAANQATLREAADEIERLRVAEAKLRGENFALEAKAVKLQGLLDACHKICGELARPSGI
jgi:hypothetical protein